METKYEYRLHIKEDNEIYNVPLHEIDKILEDYKKWPYRVGTLERRKVTYGDWSSYDPNSATA